MRKTLPAAVALALVTCGAAHAVNLNPNGVGQALLYPFYTVDNGNATAFSVVNTTDAGKALRVNFREGYNGRLALGFNVYLAPHDTWVAQVVQDAATGGAAIFTNDASCTVPEVAKTAPGQHFLTYAFDGSLPDQLTDGGPTDVTRTAEGYFEIIEMGEVTNASKGTLTAITHTNGTAANCNQLLSALDPANGYWTSNPNTDISAPRGGLYGMEAIMNVNEGSMFTASAIALDGFSAIAQHTIPTTSLLPDLSSANDAGVTDKSVAVNIPVGGKTIQTKYAHAVDAISALLASANLSNEYVVSNSIGATSEWVVTFPTKHFYVDPITGGKSVSGLAPFTHKFGADTQHPATECESVSPQIFDREGSKIAQDAVQACFETSVLTIDSATSLLSKHFAGTAAANLATEIQTGKSSTGSLELPFGDNNKLVPSAGQDVFECLPAIGFLLERYTNGAVNPGALSNFSALIPHRSEQAATKLAN
jgi:hypothetical protein